MGIQKMKWTSEEEEALIAGVAKHGAGSWKKIQNDPEFASFLILRSNINLKDKWRNIRNSDGALAYRKKPRIIKETSVSAGALTVQDSASAASRAEKDVMHGHTKSPQDEETTSWYDAIIFEAISTLKASNGSDVGAICGFIEQRHEVPQKFRRLLTLELRRLVLQGTLEKVQNCYKMTDQAFGTKTPTPKQKGLIISGGIVGDAAMFAASKIVEAENTSLVANKAVKEAERVANLAERTDSVLQLTKEIYEQCSRGEVFLLKTW